MKEMALKRMEKDLITEEAMAEAIKSSGGILTEFVRLLRDAANIANMEDRSRIKEGDMKRVVAGIRNDYIRILAKEDLEILNEVKRTKRKEGDEDRFQDLLFRLAVLEYANNEVWYDVHPTIEGIIERVEAGEG
ncbi:MAG: hypothetical protein N2V72_01535 [Methanophagales archaeon]|nr:hypothetical protein [Methanophagales archaeon]